MAASFTARALMAAALCASLALGGYRAATAAQPDSAVQIALTSSSADRVTSFGATPPPGFATTGFNDAAWALANSSPCVDAAWELPPGVATWAWAGIGRRDGAVARERRQECAGH